MCSLLQREVVPTEEQLSAMYREEPADRLEYEFDDHVAWRCAREYLNDIFANKTSVRILDIGCNSGGFLAGLSDRFQRFGIEAEGAPAQRAREVHGVNIIGERVENVDFDPPNRFDVVTMFDVLEHLPNPKLGLLAASRLLVPGGLFIFSTADADSWTWKWLGSGHWYLQTGQHLSVLSKQFTQRVVDDQGWMVDKYIQISHQSGSLAKRLHETIQLVHWSASNKTGYWRLIRRLLQELPGCRDIRHRQSVPWTMSLKDHMFVGIRVNQ